MLLISVRVDGTGIRDPQFLFIKKGGF
jgi:hypothetical protein